jgi:hypothetical protein
MHPIEHLRYVARAQGADPAALVEETAHALGSLRMDPSGIVVACRRIVQRHPFTGALWWLCANVSTSSEPFDAVWELAEEIRADRTGSELAAALPDDATVATIGDPSVIGDGLIRRGDIRVLALDVQHVATSFVRRLERYDVDCEPVDAGAAGTVARKVDAVLIEALACDSDRVIAPMGSSTIAAAAAAWGTPVWLVAGTGRRLPSGMIDAMAAKIDELTAVDTIASSDPLGVRAAATMDAWDLDVEVIPTSMITDVVGPHGHVPMGPPAIKPECPMAWELLKQSPM